MLELELELAAEAWLGGQGGEVWAAWGGWASGAGAEEAGGAGLGAGCGAGVLGAGWVTFWPWGGGAEPAWLAWGPPVWLCCWCCICWKCCWRALISAYFSCSMWKDWRSASSCWRWYSNYTQTEKKIKFLYRNYVDYFLSILHVPESLTHSLPLSVHDGFQFFKVSQFDLQLLHLGLHQQSHKWFDLPLLHCSQVLQRKWRGGTLDQKRCEK